jgi:hypothetical protein
MLSWILRIGCIKIYAHIFTEISQALLSADAKIHFICGCLFFFETSCYEFRKKRRVISSPLLLPFYFIFFFWKECTER